MNRRGLLIGLGAALGPAAALAQPRPYRFDPKGDPTLLRLSAAAAAVRAQGAIAASGFVAKGLVVPAAVGTLGVRGLGQRGSDGLLRMFFASTQIYLGHVESDSPVIGYYSPTADIWWLTLWTKSATPRVVEAKLLPGGRLTGGGPVAPQSARWVTELRTRTLIEALQVAGRSGEAAFTAEFAVDASTPPGLYHRLKSGPVEQALFRSRLLGFAQTLSDFSDDRRSYPVYGQLVKALSSPAPTPPAGLSVEAREGFARVARAPMLMRTHLSPVAAVRLQDVCFVVSANPASGRFMLLSAFRPGVAEPLQRLTLVDVLKPPGGR